MQRHARRGRAVTVTLVLVARGAFVHRGIRVFGGVQRHAFVLRVARLAAAFHPDVVRLVCGGHTGYFIFPSRSSPPPFGSPSRRHLSLSLSLSRINKN